MKTLLFVTTAALAGQLSLSAQTLFSDNFETDTSGSWTVRATSSDTSSTFGYDYSADGIPAAPNSSGSTFGLKFTANMAAPGSVESIAAYPTGQSFTGDYRVTFDMWINANGPFPAGGAGSTEFLSAGFATGNLPQSTGAGTADGLWFAVSGEGGGSQDFQVRVGNTLQGVATGYYSAGTQTNARDNADPYYLTEFPGGQTAPASQTLAFPQQTGGLVVGSVGFAWREVEITKEGNTVTWSIDGLKIAEVDATSLSLGDNVFVGYMDPFTSLSDNAALSFGIVDNFSVQAIPEPSTVALGAFGLGALYLLRRRQK